MSGRKNQQMDVPEPATTNYLFNDYSSYLRRTFGERVQKISINTGYSCPNRDGSKAYHGCTYCNITSIQPAYATRSLSISEQLEKGISFFQKRNKTGRFLAYFQSYSNTYNDLLHVQKDYEEALNYPGVVGIVVGTRPDCLSPDVAHYLQTLAKNYYVSVEIGIESTNDETLRRVNRCHTYSDVVECIELLSDKNIHIGGHLILGFPWENRVTLLSHVEKISALPLHSVKLHHLQILKHTQLAQEHFEHPFTLLSSDEYLDIVIDFVERSNPNLIFQRFLAEAPPSILVAPHYNGIRNYQFSHILNQLMIDRHTRQSRRYTNPAM